MDDTEETKMDQPLDHVKPQIVNDVSDDALAHSVGDMIEFNLMALHWRLLMWLG